MTSRPKIAISFSNWKYCAYVVAIYERLNHIKLLKTHQIGINTMSAAVLVLKTIWKECNKSEILAHLVLDISREKKVGVIQKA